MSIELVIKLLGGTGEIISLSLVCSNRHRPKSDHHHCDRCPVLIQTPTSLEITVVKEDSVSLCNLKFLTSKANYEGNEALLIVIN